MLVSRDTEHMRDPMETPTQFGSYQIVRKIGAGGMADVYEAVRIGLANFQTRVALKCILPSMTRDERFVRMFINEAHLGSQLQHPNIIQIQDFNRVNDTYYIAMEYVEGVDLARIIKRLSDRNLTIPPTVVLDIGIQALDGLGYAHRAKGSDGHPMNIIHRDIKPSNLIVTPAGVVKVGDFGIAKAANSTSNLTTDQIKGTVNYLSPEQIDGVMLGPTSDLFSLGAILFELLTLRPLFHGPTMSAVLLKIAMVNIEPDIDEIRPTFPEFVALFRHALARDPAVRFLEAASMADALRQLRHTFGPEPTLRDFLDNHPDLLDPGDDDEAEEHGVGPLSMLLNQDSNFIDDEVTGEFQGVLPGYAGAAAARPIRAAVGDAVLLEERELTPLPPLDYTPPWKGIERGTQRLETSSSDPRIRPLVGIRAIAVADSGIVMAGEEPEEAVGTLHAGKIPLERPEGKHRSYWLLLLTAVVLLIALATYVIETMVVPDQASLNQQRAGDRGGLGPERPSVPAHPDPTPALSPLRMENIEPVNAASAPAHRVGQGTGHITVESDPPGASIGHNGTPTGKLTPATLEDLETYRPHRIGLWLTGFERWVRTDVVVEPGRTTTLVATLTRTKSRAPGVISGAASDGSAGIEPGGAAQKSRTAIEVAAPVRVRLSADPLGGIVSFDGRELGEIPIEDLVTTPGTHTARFNHPDLPTAFSCEVNLQPGDSVLIKMATSGPSCTTTSLRK